MIDNNLWRNVKDASEKPGEAHWRFAEAKDVAPVLRQVEGLAAPALFVPLPTVPNLVFKPQL